MVARITPTQQEFLKILFGKAAGNLKTAAKEILGTEDYSDLLTDELLNAIKRRADSELTMNVPKAIFIMQKMLDEPESMLYMDKLHKVAADILDRAGVSKQERPSNNTMTVGIVMLPNKIPLTEPVLIEQETVQHQLTAQPV